MSFKQTSFNYLNANPEHIGANLDRDLKVAFTQMQTSDNTAIKAPTFGGSFSLDANNTTVTGATTVATKLTSISGVVATVNAGQGTPSNVWVTAEPSTQAGAIDINCWVPTAAGNTTPILSTNALKIFWIAWGSAATTS